MGDHPLYRLDMTLSFPSDTHRDEKYDKTVQDYPTSDAVSVTFGFRELKLLFEEGWEGTERREGEGEWEGERVVVMCNGVKVFIRGGDWIVSEGMYDGLLLLLLLLF